MIFERAHRVLAETEPMRRLGKVRQVIGLVVQCEGLSVPLGALCGIDAAAGPIRCEVVGFRDETALLMPLDPLEGVRRGDEVRCLSTAQFMPVGEEFLGRVVDAYGVPLDDGPPVYSRERYPLHAPAPHPLRRSRIVRPLATGIRAIDGLITLGKGQRIGLFSGSGVGKSVLLGMIARNTSADVIVIALVGERGREVREFVERDLGPEGLARSVVVVETSERPALLRVKAPFAATAAAEYYRDQGKDVLLLMDSLTRQANAQREIGLSAGEPPATKGYPPSVFAMMPRLMERAGRSDGGSITGVYTVLVEADDINEPVSDAARSILDGHVWLSRDLAHRGHYPAIDVLGSVSRLTIDVVPEEQWEAARRVRAALAVHHDAEDLINVGAYVPGSNPEIDRAIRAVPEIRRFLAQGIREVSSLAETQEALREMVKEFDAKNVSVPSGAPAPPPAPARGTEAEAAR